MQPRASTSVRREERALNHPDSWWIAAQRTNDASSGSHVERDTRCGCAHTWNEAPPADGSGANENHRAISRAPRGTPSAHALAAAMSSPSNADEPPQSQPRVRPQLRERAIRSGLDSFEDADVVALVLGLGRKGDPVHARARRLLDEAGGLAGLAGRGVGALRRELGLGLVAALRIAASIELGVRVARLARETSPEPVTCGSEVARWGRQHLIHLPHEEIWALLLDGRNRITGARPIGRGGAHACAVTARDVLRPIVREHASAFVLVHNHPSGDPCPSREDVYFTRAVMRAGAVVGIACVDHVVVAREGGVSMVESGLIDAAAAAEVDAFMST
jgi:DNA repair protein RadC